MNSLAKQSVKHFYQHRFTICDMNVSEISFNLNTFLIKIKGKMRLKHTQTNCNIRWQNYEFLQYSKKNPIDGNKLILSEV